MGSNVLLLSGIYPPDTGGPAKFVKTFSEWCSSIGVRTTVISYIDFETKKLLSESREVYLISRNTKLLNRYFKAVLLIISQQKRASAIIANGMFIEIAIARIFHKFPYVAKVPGDIVWERAKNKGFTSSDIEDFQLEVKPIALKIMRFFFTLSLKKASTVVVPSEQMRKLVQHWGIDPGKIKVVYNSVDTDLFIPRKDINKDIDVLTVCRLVPWKGLEELISNIATSDLNLTIVGNGPERLRLEKLSKSLNANVTFLGDVDQDSMPEIYARSKYFVLNSSFEATSYAMLEARSTGLVCVGNSNTGSAEIISHYKDGFVCRGFDKFILNDFFQCVKDESFNYSNFSDLSVSDTKQKFNMKTNYQQILNLIIGKS